MGKGPLVSLPVLFILSVSIRLLLVAYGHWQDLNLAVKYTDIDYVVVTDGARYVTEGKSPFLRSTYRYTPLLWGTKNMLFADLDSRAYLYTGNIYFTMLFGKMLMICSDMLVGLLIVKIISSLRVQGVPIPESSDVFYTSLWLLNPFVINVSTRYGLSVHFKIYPVIYAPALFFFIGTRYHRWRLKGERSERRADEKEEEENELVAYDSSELKFRNAEREEVKFEAGVPFVMNGSRSRVRRKFKGTTKISPTKLRSRINDMDKTTSGDSGDSDNSTKQNDEKNDGYITAQEPPGKPPPATSYSPIHISKTLYSTTRKFLYKTINRQSILFTIISASTFFGLTFGFYILYGYEFFYETYYYHIIRKDNRHNFSVYFYHIYLSTARATLSPASTPAISIVDSSKSAVFAPSQNQPDFAPPGNEFLNAPIALESSLGNAEAVVSDSLFSMILILALDNIRNVIVILSRTNIQAILLFFPQFALIVGFSFLYYRYIVFCMFVNTLAFVALNKVCTVQYFIWYFSLLPLVCPFSRIKWSTQGLLMAGLWISAQIANVHQAGWLFFAYELEFLGKNTFFEIWIMGLVYFATNIFILTQFICNQNLVDFTKLRDVRRDKTWKALKAKKS